MTDQKIFIDHQYNDIKEQTLNKTNPETNPGQP
jgi:hypothetical protein